LSGYETDVTRALTAAIDVLAGGVDDLSRQGDPFGVGESIVRPLRDLMEIRRRIEEGEL
jgi:hypothetical protein